VSGTGRGFESPARTQILTLAARLFGTNMPELHNIQTFEKLNGTNYKPVLDKFESVLRQIGLWNSEIEKEFKGFIWKVEDNGFVYSSLTQAGHFKTKYSDIKVRPHILIYTPAIDSSIVDN
jgi:hypothetical protein